MDSLNHRLAVVLNAQLARNSPLMGAAITTTARHSYAIATKGVPSHSKYPTNAKQHAIHSTCLVDRKLLQTEVHSKGTG